jgi:membrane-bound lytic murein transglycosylase B
MATKAFSALSLFLSLSVLATASACAQDNTAKIAADTVYTRAGSAFTIESHAGIDARFEPVIASLVGSGWPEDRVRAHFRDSRTVFIPKMVAVGIKKAGTGKNHYTWMDTKESVDACNVFIEKYRPILEQAEAKYGVDKETLAALLRCETRHGEVTGDYHVFSVYASMALLSDSAYLAANIQKARADLGNAKKATVDSQIDYIRSRSESRAKWAFKELNNMFKMEQQAKVDMMGIYGSWAGAFGWSQFLPSSFLSRAVDGNGDGKIDLFNPTDAIHSAANYLSNAGFRVGDAASQRRAIRNYNNSTDYVNSIMGLANRVRSGS